MQKEVTFEGKDATFKFLFFHTWSCGYYYSYYYYYY